MVNFDEKLNKLSGDVSKQLTIDNMYRNFAYLSFAIIFIVTFFLSLANAEFDFSKILQAQFWIDFIITLGGSIFLKYVFGKYGNFEGNKNIDVIQATKDVLAINKEINDKNLIDDLSLFVEDYNINKKVLASKSKVYRALLRNPKSKYWHKVKQGILVYEKIQEAKMRKDELTLKEQYDKLDEMNFTIDELKKVKYSRISLASLETGLPAQKQQDEEKMSFNEMNELFGKQIYMTIITTVFTVLAAASSVAVDSFSMKALVVFVMRIASFAMNSFTGFVSAKNAVEVVKLNVLKTIYKFLKRFVEVRGEINGRKETTIA